MPPKSRGRELPRPVRKTSHDWVLYAERATRRPGEPVLALKAGRLTQAKSVRQRVGPPFVTPEGRIVVNTRGSYTDREGVVRCDIYFTFVPWEESNASPSR